MTSPANTACQKISVKYLCLLPPSRDPALAETVRTILFQPLLAKPKLLEHKFAFSKTLGRARFTSRRSKCRVFNPLAVLVSRVGLPGKIFTGATVTIFRNNEEYYVFEFEVRRAFERDK